jgi:peptidoglycan/xylan/chitin deacetylase (PgdA/CDA1 family)
MPARRRDVLVLCYHAVSERWPAELSVTPTALEQQVRFLLERGYRPATFQEAVFSPPSRRTVAITFDDAFRSVYELALPILSRIGVPATLFVPTAMIGRGPLAWPGIDHWLGGPYEPELAAMSWDEVRALDAAGWEIGSHTRTHPRLTQLDEESLAEELTGSRRDCEQRLGKACLTLAYPYGDFDSRVVAAAEAAGYRAAGTLDEVRPQRKAPLRWPREGVYVDFDLARFARRVSPWRRRLRASRGRPLATGVRSVATRRRGRASR